MVNKPAISRGGTLAGGRLTSHDKWCQTAQQENTSPPCYHVLPIQYSNVGGRNLSG